MSTPPTGGLVGVKLMKLQLKYNAQRHTLSDVDPAMRFSEFQALVQERTTLSVAKQSLLVGFPPKEVVVSDPATQTLSALNIRTGDLITVKVREDDAAVAAALAAAAPGTETDVKSSGGVLQGKGGWEWPPSIAKNGHMIRKDMPRDNSCLFHAISYLCQPNSSSDSKASSRAMRDLIATIVAHDPATYNTAFLGSSNQTYQQTILNPDSWGGAIELSIFTRHFQTEIYAYDTHHLREDVFGGDQNYKRRVFLIYTGDHYDAMVYAPSGSGAETRVCSTKDEYSVSRAQQFVESIHLELVKNGQATKQSGFKKGGPAKPAARTGGHTANGATKWSCAVCTYAENPLNKDECLLCQAKRDSGAPSPAVAALNTAASAASAAAAAAAKPKPKPKPSAGGERVFDGSGREVWVCVSCTYKNMKSSGTTVCAMCNEPAPAQAQSAPEALIEPEPIFNPFSFFAAAAAAAPRTSAPAAARVQPIGGTVAQLPVAPPPVASTPVSPLRTPAPLQPPPGDKKAAALLADAKRNAETKLAQQQQQQQPTTGSAAAAPTPTPTPTPAAAATTIRPRGSSASGSGGSGIVIGAETGSDSVTGSSSGSGSGSGKEWQCKVCTVINDVSSVTCSACELPNPALQSNVYGQTPASATQQQLGSSGTGTGTGTGAGAAAGSSANRPAWRPPPRPSAAAAAAATTHAGSASVRPTHTEQPGFLSRALNPERSWQCERCGSAQLPTIIQCSACGQPNVKALQSGGGGDGGGCILM